MRQRTSKAAFGVFAVAISLFKMPPVSTHTTNYNKIDVRANPGNVITESDVTTPVRLRGDNTEHNGKLHYRVRSDEVSLEHQDEDFSDPRFRIVSFGNEMIIDLQQDDDLIVPAFTETLSPHSDISRAQKSSRVRGCFYKGTVAGKPLSRVTVSICDGIRGTIVTEDDEYFIEPSKRISNGQLAPHTIQKRSLRRKTRAANAKACGVNDRLHYRRYATTFMSKVDEFGRHIRKKRSMVAMNKDITVMGKNDQVLSRTRRDVKSRQHYIETLVVADKTMAAHHGHDLEHYILTVMMVANRIFAHPSLGNAVSLNVIKILRAEEDLSVSTNVQRTLRDFCNWQSKYNTPDDADTDHYDLAVLLTRRNLCGDHCDTLGMADVGAMCSSEHSCVVVEDDGLSAAYTVAHEIGHVLNMMHDDNKLCRTNFAHMNPETHMMSSTMNRVDANEPWSICSREAITDFLESGRGSCLLDKPTMFKVYPERQPGEMYSVNAQCEMSFGPGAVECPFMQECGRLWCHTPGITRQCNTRHFPKADGSTCGRGRYCFHGRCIAVDEIRLPKNGQWGTWGPFGSCSRSCDGGAKMSSRECNNPSPENGGKYCTGSRHRFRSCNTQDCPRSRSAMPDFRSEQCAAYNGKSISHLGVRVPSAWVPKYSDISGNDRCKLTCQSVQTGAFVILGNKVVDGTRCGRDTTDICVQGVCMKSGCDGVLGSKTKIDKCGVCGGGNRQCKRHKGVYKERQYGYNDVVVIPAGAASIEIRQRGYRNKVHDGNHLAVKDWTGRYLLNGGLTLSTFRKDITLNGSVLHYSGVSAVNEKIEITGKLTGDLQIQVLSLGVGSKGRILPPRVKYIYYKLKPERPKINVVSKGDDHTTTPHKLSWVTGRWSLCKPKTGTCGSGWKTRDVICRNNRKYSATGCESRVKPYDRLPCFEPCSTTPARHISHPRFRRPLGGITRTHERDPSLPNVVSRFGGQPTWIEGRWGPCSRSCNKGTKHRQVLCRAKNGQLLNDSECPEKKPESRHGCMLQDCP